MVIWTRVCVSLQNGFSFTSRNRNVIGGFKFETDNDTCSSIITCRRLSDPINTTKTSFHSHTVIPDIFLDIWKFKIRTLPAFHIFPAPIRVVGTVHLVWSSEAWAMKQVFADHRSSWSWPLKREYSLRRMARTRDGKEQCCLWTAHQQIK